MQIGDRLKYIRLSKNLSMHKLQEISDVSQSTISNIEQDTRSPQLDTLEKLCDALNVRLLDVLPQEHTQLTNEEIDFLDILHKLTPSERLLLMNFLKSVLQNRN